MSKELGPTHLQDCTRLLKIFNAESLGDGDLMAGTNVLVSMCASLANLHPPGTCLITPDGNRLQVGLSFVSAGGLTNSLVNEKVLDQIATIQNNLADHLAAEAAHSAATIAAIAPHERARVRPKAPEESSIMERLGLVMDFAGASPGHDSSPLRCLLGPSQQQGLGSITTKPAVFLSADSAEGLKRQLPQSHRRYPFVRAALTSGPGMERLQNQLLFVARGTSLQNETTGPVHVRGHIAASCSPLVLAQSVAQGEETLLANMIWLVDGFGVFTPPDKDDLKPLEPFQMHARYKEALEQAWLYRLDHRNEARTVQFDWQPLQRQWVAFLQRMEPNCPGITHAARSLAATLLFGCHLLHEPGKHSGWSVAGLLALSKLIAGRMVNRRERLLFAEEEARLQVLAIKLVEKLQEGPLSARALTRKKSNLRMGECRKVLDLFDRMGIACRGGNDEWKLVLPADRAVERLKAPCIDVE
jgi:hypothetical protein